MTTATLTERDIDHLLSLLGELTWAGRTDEATTIARVYTLACSVLYPELFDGEEDGGTSPAPSMKPRAISPHAGTLLTGKRYAELNLSPTVETHDDHHHYADRAGCRRS